MDRWLGELERLLTFGRQGLFVHDNTHHALYMAYAAVPAGYALMMIRVAQNLITDIADMRAGRPLRRGTALI